MKVPLTVCVEPAAKSMILPGVTDVKSKKVVSPVNVVLWPLSSNSTSPDECVNVPPVCVKLPATVNVLPVPGAVNVPDVMVTDPLASILPLVAVNVPPPTVKIAPVVNVLVLVEMSSAVVGSVRLFATVKLPLVWKVSFYSVGWSLF